MGTKDDGDGGAGWSGPILDRNQRLLDMVEGRDAKTKAIPSGLVVPFDPAFAWPASGAKGGSPNHECGAWSGQAVWAGLCGTRAQQDAAYGVLLQKYYPRELGPGKEAIGLRVSEFGCPDNHTHQHDQGVGMGRVAAVIAKENGHPNAAELMERSGELLRATSMWMQAIATPGPDYFVCGPGMRSPGKPVFWWGTAFLRQLKGQPGPMPEFAPRPGRPDLWRDRASVGVRALRWLQKHGDDLGGAASVGPGPVKLKFEMLVYRGPNQHLAVIPQPKSGKGGLDNICDWVLAPWGAKDFGAMSAQVSFGLKYEKQAPKPQAGAQLIHFPAMWG